MNPFKKLWQGFIDRLMILWDRLFRKPRHKPVVSDAELAIGLPAAKKEPLRVKKFFFHEYYPNMPRYQPCPKCDTGSARRDKRAGGALYTCTKYGQFFVPASARARGYI